LFPGVAGSARFGHTVGVDASGDVNRLAGDGIASSWFSSLAAIIRLLRNNPSILACQIFGTPSEL